MLLQLLVNVVDGLIQQSAQVMARARASGRTGRVPVGRLMRVSLPWVAVAACWFLNAPTAHAQERWLLQTAGVSHHFSPTEAAGRHWNEENPGLGLERRVLNADGWSERLSGGVLQDSRAFWGGYAGMSWVKEWQTSQVKAGLGVGGYAFYRSVSWSGRMAVVPAVLPVVSLELPRWGVGVNMLYVPPLGWSGEKRTSVFYAQLTVPLP